MSSNQFHLNLGKIIAQDSITPKLNSSLLSNFNNGQGYNQKNHMNNNLNSQGHFNGGSGGGFSQRSHMGFQSPSMVQRGYESKYGSLSQSQSNNMLNEEPMSSTDGSARSQARHQEKIMRTRHLETLEFLSELKNSVLRVENQVTNLAQKCSENFGRLAEATEKDLERLIGLSTDQNSRGASLMRGIESTVRDFKQGILQEVRGHTDNLRGLNEAISLGQQRMLNETDSISLSLQVIRDQQSQLQANGKKNIQKTFGADGGINKNDLDEISALILEKIDESTDLIKQCGEDQEQRLTDKIIEQASSADNRIKQIDQKTDSISTIANNIEDISKKTDMIEEQTDSLCRRTETLNKKADKLASISILTTKISHVTEHLNKMTDDIDKRTEGIDRRTESIEIKTEGLNRRTESIDIRTEGMDKRTESIDKRTEGMDKRTESIDKRTEGIDRRTEGIEIKTEGLNRRTESIDKRTESFSNDILGLNKPTKDFVNVVQCLDVVAKVTEDINRIDKRTESLTKVTEGINRRTESLTKVTEGINRRTESLTKVTEGINKIDKRSEELIKGIDSINNITDNIYNRTEIINNIDKRTELFSKSLEDINKSTCDIIKRTESIGKMSEEITDLTRISDTINKVTNNINNVACNIEKKTEVIDKMTGCVKMKSDEIQDLALRISGSVDDSKNQISESLNVLSGRMQNMAQFQYSTLKRKYSDKKNEIKAHRDCWGSESDSDTEGEDETGETPSDDFDPLACFTPDGDIIENNTITNSSEEKEIIDIRIKEDMNKGIIEKRPRKRAKHNPKVNKRLNNIPLTDTTEEENTDNIVVSS